LAVMLANRLRLRQPVPEQRPDLGHGLRCTVPAVRCNHAMTLSRRRKFAMGFAAPFAGAIQRVEDQWIDYNGHFNMAYYNVIFDRCGDEAFASLGLGPAYVKATNCSFFTLEAHLTYVRELHAGDAV